MERDPGKTTVRCNQCGSEVAPSGVDDGETVADRIAAKTARTFSVVVACASCGTPFVVLGRN